MSGKSLDEIKQMALSCTKCRLSQGRTQVVWMDGDESADLMFIGEAPGFHEDRQGIPFVGAAGKVLDSMLASIGRDRSRCTICNVIKCRPPGNRDPLPDEIDSCEPYLQAQIAAIKPRVIVPLGNFATRFILGKQVSISKVRGQRFEGHGAVVIPTFHPAAALHSGGEKSPAMAALRSDFQTIAAVLAELEHIDVSDEERSAEQVSLF
ncbi:MAG: uracil-DNA glycosylase [Actinomycetota bacterium]|nr:uracil-DNA glycosylase [Actinomycetota bacterium]